MFNPAIYLTHKTLRQVVNLELADFELSGRFGNFYPKNSRHFVLGVFTSLQKDYVKTLHTENAVERFLAGTNYIEDLVPLRNAWQAAENYETSLRALDDFNFLVRLNQLLVKDNVSIGGQIRGVKKPVEKNSFKFHEFDDASQVEHFLTSLFQWYRTSDTEVNRFLRVFTLLYHLLKTSPFESKNKETIYIAIGFYLRENNIRLLNILNLFDSLDKTITGDIDLNEFINTAFDLIIQKKNKLFYNFEKDMIEITSPKKILNLNRRQIELLKVMQARDKINRSEAAEILDVSFMTAYRDIKGLLKSKLLREQGVGRGTYYVLGSK